MCVRVCIACVRVCARAHVCVRRSECELVCEGAHGTLIRTHVYTHTHAHAQEVVPCARGTLGMSFGKPRCLVVRATADNPTDKPISNADVFGRVRDALGQNALDVDEARCACAPCARTRVCACVQAGAS